MLMSTVRSAYGKTVTKAGQKLAGKVDHIFTSNELNTPIDVMLYFLYLPSYVYRYTIRLASVLMYLVQKTREGAR